MHSRTAKHGKENGEGSPKAAQSARSPFLNYDPLVSGSTTFREKLANLEPRERITAFFHRGMLMDAFPKGILRSAVLNPRAVKNWFDLLLVEAGLKREADAAFRSGHVFKHVRKENLQAFRSARHAENHDHKIIISASAAEVWVKGSKLSFSLPEEGVGTLFEVFSQQAYKRLECEGRTVLDVGAWIGDTPLYFSARGAERVIALEPTPKTYELAKENIERNSAGSKIVLLNAGISAAGGAITVNERTVVSSSNQLAPSTGGRLVGLYSLADLVREFGIKDGLLKLDCEGGEYPAILGSSPETLRSFRQMAIETHRGAENIVVALENAGFRVEKDGKTRYHLSRAAKDRHIFLNMLFAERMD